MKNSAKFLIISLTAAVVACPVTPEGGGDSSAAREYKITYTVSGSDSVTSTVPPPPKPAIRLRLRLTASDLTRG